MGSVGEVLLSLFWLSVGAGVLVMFLRNPAKTNALISAVPSTYAGIVHANESGSIS